MLPRRYFIVVLIMGLGLVVLALPFIMSLSQTAIFYILLYVIGLGRLYFIPILFLGGILFLSWIVGPLVGSELLSGYILASLCRREAGAVVNDRAHDVQGVQLRWYRTAPGFCNPYCVQLLDFYDFVEVDLPVINSRYMTPRSGIYRFQLAEPGAPECEIIKPIGRE